MIRQFHPEDAEPCSALVRSCLANDLSLSPAMRAKLQEAETPGSMEERARLFYVAVYESEGQILGVAGLDLNEIRLLCTSPGHRRRGIGRALLEHLESMVPGFLFSDIFVYSSSQGREFYRACGFTEKGLVGFDLRGEKMLTWFMTFPMR